jgi:Bardet-Biedl syndrome 9 protein
MIQKRLLNRFKDKNPSPLNNLDYLLGHTYNQIIAMALEIEKHTKNSKIVAYNLGCTLECFLICLRLKSSMQNDQFAILKNYISTNVDINNETGWLEST